MGPAEIILFIFSTALTLMDKGTAMWESAKRKGELTPEQDAALAEKANAVKSKWAAREAALKVTNEGTT